MNGITAEQLHELTDDQIDRMVADKQGWKYGTEKNCCPDGVAKEQIPGSMGDYWWFEGRLYLYHPKFTRDWAACGVLLEQLARIEGNTVMITRWMNLADMFVVRLVEENDGQISKSKTYAANPSLLRSIAINWLLAQEVKE